MAPPHGSPLLHIDIGTLYAVWRKMFLCQASKPAIKHMLGEVNIPGVGSMCIVLPKYLCMEYDLSPKQNLTSNNDSHLACPPCFPVKSGVIGENKADCLVMEGIEDGVIPETGHIVFLTRTISFIVNVAYVLSIAILVQVKSCNRRFNRAQKALEFPPWVHLFYIYQ